jgi:hypothetical protein
MVSLRKSPLGILSHWIIIGKCDYIMISMKLGFECVYFRLRNHYFVWQMIDYLNRGSFPNGLSKASSRVPCVPEEIG